MIHLKNKNALYLLFGLFLISSFTFAQTAVAKTEVEGEDVLFDFRAGEKRGIILPWVTQANQVVTPVGGTLIFDSNDKKVKYYKTGTSPNWVDLSINSGSVDLNIQNGLTELDSRTVIGDNTKQTPGLLILEATDKAMVLPKVNSPHLNLLSPASGTIVFDTESKQLCVFNGKEWTFWKASR